MFIINIELLLWALAVASSVEVGEEEEEEEEEEVVVAVRYQEEKFDDEDDEVIFNCSSVSSINHARDSICHALLVLFHLMNLVSSRLHVREVYSASYRLSSGVRS